MHSGRSEKNPGLQDDSGTNSSNCATGLEPFDWLLSLETAHSEQDPDILLGFLMKKKKYKFKYFFGKGPRRIFKSRFPYLNHLDFWHICFLLIIVMFANHS